ncbi:MAG TPA: PKD domain-containing protein, partial [Ferruginibacter sp.]|nr:PKD domain-containing protein [Ferruginibacter sp.]
MKKLLLLFSFFFYFLTSEAQITGSDTACAGYIYTYTVNMPGAVSFNWTLPSGWYFINGQGTNSVVVNCNVNAGQVCVTGYDAGLNTVGSFCKTVSWGTGGIGWYVSGIQTCLDPPCCSHHSYVLNVQSQGPSCAGGCGTGYQNPNIIFAGFDNVWPSGNFLGQVNGVNQFIDLTGMGMTVFVYAVDTTFGINNPVLVEGLNGCGPVNNTFYIPPEVQPWIVNVPLIQTPDPVCIGDTFVVSMDPFYSSNIDVFGWNPFAGNCTLIGPLDQSSVTAVLNGPGLSTIHFNGSDFTGCHWSMGDLTVNYSACTPPAPSQINGSDTVCAGYRYTYTASITGATTYHWTLPTGWFFISGQGTDSVVVTCNVNAGQVCVAGHDATGNLIDSICHATVWGTSGSGWYVAGTQHCVGCPCATSYYYTLAVVPQGPVCTGSCGNGYYSPNLIYAAYSQPTPSFSFYLGNLNNPSTYFPATGNMVYVYLVDITFGINNAILIQGGNGCGPVNNTFFVPSVTLSQVTVNLVQSPGPVCIGQSFTVTVTNGPGSSASFSWTATPNMTIISQQFNSVTAVINSPGPASISYFSVCNAEFIGNININYQPTPAASFVTSTASICQGTCINFTNASQYSTSALWSFPGATPSSSSSFNPSNICYNTPGNYSVTLTASNSCSSNSTTLSNYIHVYAPPTVTIQQNADTLSIQQGFVNYQWYLNNVLIPGATTYQYIATQLGNYSVSITDSHGCHA